MSADYTPSIGIETHLQLKTKTKLFSAVSNEARDAQPNSLISHIDAGLPGALPVLNSKALELALRMGVALGGQPQKFSRFDRKHYFYPDLPKGYQISQYEQPLILGGQVEPVVDGRRIKVGLVRVHLEEDAGKNIHPPGADYSLVDLNRAGTPLLEIVSQPDIHSPAEAKAFARELYLIAKYAGVSDGDMFLGNLRFDINVSVSRDPRNLGVRTEVKNLNSFRSVENAAAYEIDRQTEVLKKGGQVVQETRGWDEAKQKTISQRGKEEAEDYRYMPEPDIPPIILEDQEIERIKQAMPILPSDIRPKLGGIKIDDKVAEDLLDRPTALRHTLAVLKDGQADAARRTAFWFIHAIPPASGAEHQEEIKVEPAKLAALSSLVDRGTLSSNAAAAVFDELAASGGDPSEIATRLNLIQLSDGSELEELVSEVISGNEKAAAEIRAGNQKAVAFLVGQAMAKSKGRANPELVNQLVRKKLGLG